MLVAVVAVLEFHRLAVLHLLVVAMVLMAMVRLDLQTLAVAAAVLGIFLMCHHK